MHLTFVQKSAVKEIVFLWKEKNVPRSIYDVHVSDIKDTSTPGLHHWCWWFLRLWPDWTISAVFSLFCTIVLTKNKSKQDNILPQKMFLLFWSENSTHKPYGATFGMKKKSIFQFFFFIFLVVSHLIPSLRQFICGHKVMHIQQWFLLLALNHRY